MLKPIQIAVAVILAMLAACSNNDDRERFLDAAPIQPVTLPEPPVVPMDVAGTWFSRAENNAVNCGLGEYVDAKSVVISQSDTEVSMLLSTGDSFSGTVNGDIVEWSGSYPERNGMTDFTSTSLVFTTEAGDGNAMWTWSDGSDSCNGMMALSLVRNAVAESAANSRPDIADPFEFVDNVAYFTGSLGNGGDSSDLLTFTAEQDALLQVELSHFDIASSNLDLIILDENLNEIASSQSTDGFEMLDVPVVGGASYFVQIDATSISGADTYNLALDIN